jgi:hypothetical protein
MLRIDRFAMIAWLRQSPLWFAPRHVASITEGESLIDSTRRLAAVAWLVGGVAWLVKLTLILANGGSNTDEGLVAAVFFAGVLALVVAGAASGFTLLRRWGIWAAVIGVPIGVAATLVGISVIDSVLQPIVPASGWYDEEVGILGAAVIALLLGLALLGRGRSSSATESAAASAEA